MSETANGAELQVISTEECLSLLATHEIGRLGVNAEHYPQIFPVNYGMDHGVIIIRTDVGSKLSNAQHANITFEVDDIDRRLRSGWSVLVKGQAEEVTSEHRAELVERTKRVEVEPWAPGEHGHWLRLLPHAITGRRIVPGQLPPIFERGAYL